MSSDSTNLVDGLDAPCPACGKPAGDHTVREFHRCADSTMFENEFKTPDYVMPYSSLGEAGRVAQERLHKQFGLDDDLGIADHVTAKAAVLSGEAVPLKVTVPAVIHDFAMGGPGGVVFPVARIMFVGSPETMRMYGKLVSEAADKAASAAERGRG